MVPNPGSIVFLIILAACILPPTAAGQTNRHTPVSLSPQTAEPVVLHVTVTGGDAYVKDLKASDFEVTVDKKPARVVGLSHADPPVSVGIILDSSGPVSPLGVEATYSDFDSLQEPMRHFFESSKQTNNYFLIGFDNKPQLLIDWTSAPTPIIDQLARMKAHRKPAFFDACYLAIDKLRSAGHPKRVLLLISDGLDNSSHHTFSELRELLRAANVLVYTINFQYELDPLVGLHGVGALADLSFISGGRSFSSRGGNRLRLEDTNAALEIIATELRNQYALSVVPTEVIDPKKWHKIKVNLNSSGHPKVKDLTVRTRASFYPR